MFFCFGFFKKKSRLKHLVIEAYPKVFRRSGLRRILNVIAIDHLQRDLLIDFTAIKLLQPQKLDHKKKKKEEWGELLTSWLPLHTPECETRAYVSDVVCMQRRADGVNNG